MKKINKLFSNPVYLLLGFLVVLLSYMYLNNYSYAVGKELGNEIIVSYRKQNLIVIQLLAVLLKYYLNANIIMLAFFASSKGNSFIQKKLLFE